MPNCCSGLCVGETIADLMGDTRWMILVGLILIGVMAFTWWYAKRKKRKEDEELAEHEYKEIKVIEP